MLALFKVQPRSATGAGQVDDDDDPEAAALVKKRQRTHSGFVATRTDYLDARRAAALEKERDATLRLYAGDAEYERVTKVFTEWEALKTQFPCLISRVHEGVELAASVLARLLTLTQLKTCVEGGTSARAKQANKPAQAAIFLAAGVGRQLVQPAKPIGYDSRIAERQERAAAAAAAAASSASGAAPTDAAASAQTMPTQP